MGTFWKSSLTGLACAIAFAMPAHAETIVTANIPFAFVIHGHVFPAGLYEISGVRDGDQVIAIQGHRTGAAGFAIAVRADGHDPLKDQPSLVFTHVENTYLLAQIWESGSTGLDIAVPQSHRDRNRRAGAQLPQPTVILAALSR